MRDQTLQRLASNALDAGISDAALYRQAAPAPASVKGCASCSFCKRNERLRPQVSSDVGGGFVIAPTHGLGLVDFLVGEKASRTAQCDSGTTALSTALRMDSERRCP